MIRFPRYVGYYKLSNFLSYLFPNKHAENDIKKYLPKTNCINYYYQARNGILSILLFRKQKTDKKYIAIPKWSCNILQCIIEKSGFIPCLLDIDPVTLKIKANDFQNNLLVNKTDAIILVSENGQLYEQSEIDYYKSLGLIVIADFSLALQNYRLIKDLVADYYIFSGGFSKPVSSLELGIVTSNNPNLKLNAFSNKIKLAEIAKIFLHRLLQKRLIYFLFLMLNKSKKVESLKYNQKPSIRNLSVLLENIRYKDKHRGRIFKVQEKIVESFKKYQIKCSLTNPNTVLYSKFIFKLDKRSKTDIELHQQYNGDSIDHLKQYYSISINEKVINYPRKFILSLNKLLRFNSI